MKSEITSLEAFFDGRPFSRQLFDCLAEMIHSLGHVDLRVTKSQVAFRCRKAFAWAWLPQQYLQGRGAPLVVSIALRRRDPSKRWKQVVQPKPGWFMHHLELNDLSDLDDEVKTWLQEARSQAL